MKPEIEHMYIPGFDLPTKLDFIEFFAGIPNLTRDWNQFGLNLEVVEKVVKGFWRQPLIFAKGESVL